MSDEKKLKKRPRAAHRRRIVLFKLRNDKNNGVSIRVKFAVVLLISAVLVITAALILIPIAVSLITDFYMEPERVNDRLEDYINDFSDYVLEERITSDDAASVAQWSVFHRNVHLVVFGGENAQFGVADGEILEGDDVPEVGDTIFSGNIPDSDSSDMTFGNTYIVRFADRVCSVSVIDYSGMAVYNGVHTVGIVIAMFVFFVILLVYHHRQTKAILNLSSEVEEVSGGALSAPIHSKRNDEIGGLARDVDIMRATILQKMEDQRAAREANGELITSMSHDIRTPLTTLLGYMELLQNDADTLTEEQRTYVQLCTEKAEQIKELSDKLFLYFWAYHVHEELVDTEPCDAMLLLEQMMGEWGLPMETEGISLEVKAEDVPAGTRILVNTECLRRIIGNVFDNIRKYAHRSHPVKVTLRMAADQREVVIAFGNIIGNHQAKTTGTHIGHKTCVNMAQLMGGRFETSVRGNAFEAGLYLRVDA